ncbi:hypothetical protein JTE90_000607 [Oedothorax gibbosus]|uniref:Uncharacterized protein n=1 Tax=Oedothorax gibbosus TaxID=931172 RepID=A0AAV6VUW7_9ARAC|nr:hypothetical protein JTE90_000607 [Oedothorax gibbosus]
MVLLGLLLLTATCSGKDPENVDLKRNPSAKPDESLLSSSSEESPSHRYSAKHYEANLRQEPKDEYNDPGVDYERGKDDEVPHAYHFGYEVNDEKEGHQYRHEQKDEKGNVQGQFGYRDAKGQFRQVEYVADNHGFRARVKTNEAGVDNQNPADVELHKEEGQDFQAEYSKNVYSGHSADEKVQHSEKSSSSNYYHQEPADEGKSHMAPQNYYHHQSQVGSEPHGASHYYQRQPVENKPHGGSNAYYRQPEVEKEPHIRMKQYHRQPVESGSSEEYKRQPVVESEPHPNHYEYEPKYEHPYATHDKYYPHNAEQEPNRYQKNQNEEPLPNLYYMAEQDSHADNNDYSSEKHHSIPRTEIYKRENKIVPPQPYVEKSPTRAPTTYQYELQRDGKSYKYVKKPLPSESENEKAHHQAYYPKGGLHQMEEPDLRSYGQTAKQNGGESYDSGEQKLILPQTTANEYNVHPYQNAYSYHHNPSNQDHSNEETGASKYDYNGGSLSGHSKEAEPEIKVVPEAHQYQYVQIDENQVSNPDISYRQQYVPHQQNIVQPQQIVVIDPRKTQQMKEKVIAYREPQTSSSPALTFQANRNEHQPMKKAVLELNPQVYQKLLENKSPGQSIVAIPVNERHMESSGQSAEPPHGVLHITVDDPSAFNPKASPIVLQIGNQEDPTHSRNNGHRHRVPVPFAGNHHTYAQSSANPMYQPNNQRQEDKESWIPVSQAWRQRIGRTSANGDSTHVSKREGFKFLQAESSSRKVNFQRQPPKAFKISPIIHERVIPGIYIINTSKRVSKSKDSKSALGHTLISLTTP